MTNIRRVYTAHIINTVAMSVIGVYVPIFLLNQGFSLSQVILYYAVAPITGLFLMFFVYVPLLHRQGLVRIFKLYYPLQILQFTLLFSLRTYHIPLLIASMAYGAANYAYWIPLNQLFVRHSKSEEMAGNVSKLFALPNLFGIIGPLIGAVLVPALGFWPVFAIAAIGIFCSYIPLTKVKQTAFSVDIDLSYAWNRFKKNKALFFFELLDNVIEESEWFWPIYVYLLIGKLSTPGLVGSLIAIGGGLFTFLAGKYVKEHGKKLVPVAALLLLCAFVAEMAASTPVQAYVISVAGSFVLTFFLVAYFTTIYKTIKNNDEEGFLILREIPVAAGRLIVFATIWLTVSNLRLFFITPIVFSLILLGAYYWKGKRFRD